MLIICMYVIIDPDELIPPICVHDRDIIGMVTLGHMMSMMMKNQVNATNPVSKALYKQFKTVSRIFEQLKYSGS